MREHYISIDIETSGPIPGDYSMLTLGACAVDDDTKMLYVELKPLNDRAVPEAMQVSGLSLEPLARDGLEPADAMRALDEWIQTATPKDCTPVFVGLNAPFDWSFVNYYFIHFLGGNPFGFSAVDIKALYMGA